MVNLLELYRTKDLAEAGLLIAKGMKLLRVEREAHVCWFIFKDQKACKELCDSMWFGECLVDARSYYQSMNMLKNRIFSKEV